MAGRPIDLERRRARRPTAGRRGGRSSSLRTATASRSAASWRERPSTAGAGSGAHASGAHASGAHESVHDGIGLSLSELLGELYLPAANGAWLDPDDGDAA